jgi:hypothetical protein
LPAGGVGEHAEDAVALDVGDAELRAGVGAFAAQDQPGARRPGTEVDQAGGFSDPGTVAGLNDRVVLTGAGCSYLVGGCPGLLGKLGQDAVDVEVVQVGATENSTPVAAR